MADRLLSRGHAAPPVRLARLGLGDTRPPWGIAAFTGRSAGSPADAVDELTHPGAPLPEPVEHDPEVVVLAEPVEHDPEVVATYDRLRARLPGLLAALAPARDLFPPA